MPKHYTEVDSQSTLTNLKDAGFLSSSVGLVRSVSPGSNPVRYGSPSKVVFFYRRCDFAPRAQSKKQ